MTGMRINWDKYEVALLIDTYLKSKRLIASAKMKAYEDLSIKLREKAVSGGHAIDGTFRNLNGITMRIANIQYLFEGKGLSSYSDLDKEMVSMYFSNPKKFNTILDEARSMVSTSNNSSIFQKFFNKKRNQEKHSERLTNAVTGKLNSVKSSESTDYKTLNIRLLIYEKFNNGIRFDYSLELRKFKQLYEETFNEKIMENDLELKDLIRSVGIEYRDRVYSPEAMLDSKTKQRLFDYINATFASGKKILFYDTIFHDFEEYFYPSRIYNSEMLKLFLNYFNEGQYHINHQYISSDNLDESDIVETVRNCIKYKGCVTNYADIKKTIPQIPIEKIKFILASNSEFIWTSKEHYIHIDNVFLNETDLVHISSIIMESIDRYGYITGNKLFEEINKRVPDIIEKNPSLINHPVGLRDSIKYYLYNKFSFNGNVISSIANPLTMSDIFADFCRHQESFTLETLNTLGRELGSGIYFDPVYDNSLRINRDNFISKSKVNFDIQAVDSVISKLCPGDYMPISEFTQFVLFPGMDYPWNSFILEHYVHSFSKDFKLLHAASFNATKCVGAIVRRTSQYEDFNTLIANVLAEANLELNISNALEYLSLRGYLGRKRYSDIENVLLKAQGIKARKE